MAGHKFSGYIRLVWQSLFAAFARLFRRIFPLLWKNNTSPGPQPPAVSDADHTEAETQDSSTTTAGPASNVTSESDHPPDLEKGQQQTEDEVMAASKKRGNKRSGVKPENSTQPATATGAIMTGQRDKENMGPGKQIGQSAAASTATETQKTPLGTSRGIGKIDTKGTSQQPDAQRPTSAGSKSSGKSRGRPSPTATQFDDTIKTEGPAPAREAPTVVCSQTPAITSTVPAEGKSEVQGTGSHSQTGTQNPDLAPKPATTKRADDELVHIQAQQAVVAIDQLALDDNTPGPEKALTKDTAAVEAAGVPVVVVNPISGQPPITLKPLAPLVTPPSHVLPGLIEPDTEEGKRERAVHLDFMREALNMVSISIYTLDLGAPADLSTREMPLCLSMRHQ